MIESLGESGKLVVAYARRIAANLRHAAVGPEHLFLGVGDLEDLAIRRALSTAGMDLDEIARRIRNDIGLGSAFGPAELPLTPEAEAILKAAEKEAVGLGGREVEAQHIILALLRSDGGPVARALSEAGVDRDAARGSLTGAIEAGETTPSDFYKERRNIEQATLGKTAQVLESLGRDLTEAAEKGELSPIIGRDKEIAELVAILLAKEKNNAILIGEAGVGKTAIVEGLAQKIVAHQIPHLDGMRIRTIEVGSLVAGTIFRGQFEQRLKDLIDYVRNRKDIILFIDEMHMLVGAGETGLGGSVDASNMLKPVLTGGKLKVIGATTTDEYRRHLEPHTALMRRFHPIVVGEPSPEDTLTILRGLREKYEQFHVVSIAEEALKAAVDLSSRYLHDRYLPDKALDLLDRACTDEKLGASGLLGRPPADPQQPLVVEATDIAEVVSVLLEVPIARLTEDEGKRLTGMADAIKQRVIAQDHAVDAVCRAIVRARSGVMEASERPYGVFLFLGPTGVGKTKLAQEVAAFLFGDKKELVNLDMSHYEEPYSASELIGNRTGVVGWERGGKLTNPVREKPYSVVLLDEFEKAHPSVWNLFLPIFENGRMTDALERVIDFRNTVIIMTSNVGARRFQIRTRIGFAGPDEEEEERRLWADTEKEVVQDAKDLFPPELVNRIDEIVVFRPLNRDALRRIVRHELDAMVAIDLEISPDALEFLVGHSYDPAMGARPVRRAIQRLVANPLSLMMTGGELTTSDAVKVGVSDGALTFEKSQRAMPAPATP